MRIKPTSERVVEFTVVPQKPGLFELSKFTWYFHRLFNQYEVPKYRQKS